MQSYETRIDPTAMMIIQYLYITPDIKHFIRGD